MRPLVLTLRTDPDERLDLSALVPHRLTDKTAAEIGKLELQTGRQRITVGDIFRVRVGDPQRVRIEGGTDRFDQVGQDMAGGEIVVEGDVGNQAGRLMTNGRLIINGNAGRWAASGMQGGQVEIAGSAGDRVGGPLAGEMAGMRGGVVVVRGDVGERVGDRLRRGTIVVEGRAGAYAGSGMIAGTLIVRRAAGPLPGYLMRRGTVVLAGGCDRAVADISRLWRARPCRHAAHGSICRGLQRCRCCCSSRTAAAACRRYGRAGQGGSLLRGCMTSDIDVMYRQRRANDERRRRWA